MSGISPLTFKSKNSHQISVKSVIGASIGTALPLMMLAKKRKINPLNLQYGLKDMVILSASAITGGTAGGMINEERYTRKSRLKEGVFQLLNAIIPTWIVGGAIKLSESNPKYNKKSIKILSIIAGLAVGMFGAAQISNLIFDPKDKEPDRKLSLKDCVANIDDAFGALILARFPLIEHLRLERVLPLIYLYCGIRAGNVK